MTGKHRNQESRLSYLLEHFPAVAIIGARQVGKTTLARQVKPDWEYFDLENPQHYQRIAHDPNFFFKQYPHHMIIDEAQLMPELFNVLRGVIDEERQLKGRFILTGSSSPELLTQISESLAGRISTLELGTLKANEVYQAPLSPWYQLFESKINKGSIQSLVKTKPPLTNQQLTQHWLEGGYPEPVLADNRQLYDQWMSDYQFSYINRDIARLFPKLNKIAYQRFLSMLSKLSGTIINKSQLARDIEVDEKTIRDYLTIADGTFIWRILHSYENKTQKPLVKMPKGYIRDSGLLNYLLRIHDINDLYEDPRVGNLFEAFVIEEIVKGLQAKGILNWQAYYYRTRNGSEIDLILEGYFGVMPIEIKYNARVDMKKLTALKNFVKDNNLPFGMLINQGDRIEWLCEEVIQIPIEWL